MPISTRHAHPPRVPTSPTMLSFPLGQLEVHTQGDSEKSCVEDYMDTRQKDPESLFINESSPAD